MVGDENRVEKVVDFTLDYPESGRIVAVNVLLVPDSDEYPSGVKYSMHYGEKGGDTPIIRYDNAHEATKGHERHTPEGVEEVDFHGWRQLLDRFIREVRTHEQDD